MTKDPMMFSPPSTEQWRAVTGFEGVYEVSSLGRVRCWVYGGGATRHGQPRIKKPQRNRNGYLYVVLGGRRRYKGWTIHRLVLTAFVGPRPTSIDACHLNGDKSDNRLANLVWATRQVNESHKRAHGTAPYGEVNGQSKLTTEEVRQIKRSLRLGESQRAIADRFGVTAGNVSCIALGKSWTHIREEGQS